MSTAIAPPKPESAAPSRHAPVVSRRSLPPVFAAGPFPVNLDLSGRPVLVVGGGPVAARKTATLLSAGAEVTVVAPDAAEKIASDPAVRWRRRPYRAGEAGGYRLVIAASDDAEVNARVAGDADAAGVFVNSADDPANCSFTLMSVLRRGDLQLTVSTNGRSPALARWVRRQLEVQIDASHAELLELLADARAEARAVFGTSELPGWEEALDRGLIGLVRAGRNDEARSLLWRCLGLRDPGNTGAAAATTDDPAVSGPANGSRAAGAAAVSGPPNRGPTAGAEAGL